VNFNSYYNAERILVAEAPLRSARLALSLPSRQVLRNGFRCWASASRENVMPTL